MKVTRDELWEKPLPWYYGVAYRLPLQMSVVAYPLPVNVIVRWARGLYYRLVARDPTWWEHRELEMRYRTDRRALESWQKGYDAGRASVLQSSERVSE